MANEFVAVYDALIAGVQLLNGVNSNWQLPGATLAVNKLSQNRRRRVEL